MVFKLAESHLCEEEPDWLIVTQQNKLLSFATETWRPLPANVAEGLKFTIDHSHYLGLLDGGHCFACECHPDHNLVETNFDWVSLYSQLGQISDEHFQLAGRALQLVRWYNDHQYCGRCGGATRAGTSDRARVCNQCTLRFYPRLSPCIICLIKKGSSCLLAHAAKHPAGMYSTLAGFIEPGETVEQALEREVLEEVNVKVKNIRYFGSQPWPFPGQLMLGFLADYHSGEIRVDGLEIVDAHWYQVDNLPQIPPVTSISGRLIKQFVQETLSQSQGESNSV